MKLSEIPAAALPAIRARNRKYIEELEYRRELRKLNDNGYSQREISSWLGIAQPSVLSVLRTAAKVPMPLDGFSGATPLEICQRYAGGLIDRAQLVDELTRFPYAKQGETDGYDSLIVDPPGTWSEVDDAVRRGLIEDEVYDEVFDRRHGVNDRLTEEEASFLDRVASAIRNVVEAEVGEVIGVHRRLPFGAQGFQFVVKDNHGVEMKIFDTTVTSDDTRAVLRLGQLSEKDAFPKVAASPQSQRSD